MAAGYDGRLAQALAFVGNSLLAPVSQTERVGLDGDFWQDFPDFGMPAVGRACDRMAHIVGGFDASREEDVRDVSVEFTRLFVGPPSPAAAPWETMYRTGGHVGFGSATVEMQKRLEQLHLKVSNENRQDADHIGLELLYLSELVRRASEGDEECAARARAFARLMEEWVPQLHERVNQKAPDGYYDGIVGVACALIACV